MKKHTQLLLLCGLISANIFAQTPLADDFYQKLPFKMEPIKSIEFPKNEVNITSFGAKGNGLFDNTDAFVKAIDAIVAKGGGVVNVPAGHWITGPIALKSNVNLHLERGALITFTKDKTKYPIIKTSFEGYDTRRCTSPITATNQKNIAITGEGIIDGSGDAWRAIKKDKLTGQQWKKLVASGGVLSEDGKSWYPSESYKKGLASIIDQNVPNIKTEAAWDSIRDFLRPVMVSLVSCENILLQGVTFQNSPAWCLHPLMCTNIQVIGVSVRNEWNAQNSDAIDLESCKNALIYNSSFDVGDDDICLKSGKDEDGRRRAIPTENVVVTKCVVYKGHGGFVVGSEMSGGVKNVYVDNCVFMGTDVGIRFKSKRGRGGVVENIYVNNVKMINIETDPLLFDLFYGGKSASESLDDKNEKPAPVPVTVETPSFKNIYIKDVTCNGALRAMYFNGLPEMNVLNVNLENMTISAESGAVLSETDGVTMKNIVINAKKGTMLSMYNVKNATIDNVSSSKPENDIVKIDGETSKDISVRNMNLKKENLQSNIKIKK